MEPIVGKDLAQLVTDASNELIGEQYREGVTKVKKLLHGVAELSREIAQMKATLDKKEKQLTGKQATLEKIKGGDWTALEVKENQGDNQSPSGEKQGD